MIKWIAALAAVSLVAAPVAAQEARTASPVEESESLRGNGLAWLVAALFVIAAVLYLTDDDDDFAVVSP